MSEIPTGEKHRRRSRGSKIAEFLFWTAVALLTAWILIQNIERILPANNF